jgi:hypothetical protein
MFQGHAQPADLALVEAALAQQQAHAGRGMRGATGARHVADVVEHRGHPEVGEVGLVQADGAPEQQREMAHGHEMGFARAGVPRAQRRGGGALLIARQRVDHVDHRSAHWKRMRQAARAESRDRFARDGRGAACDLAVAAGASLALAADAEAIAAERLHLADEPQPAREGGAGRIAGGRREPARERLHARSAERRVEGESADLMALELVEETVHHALVLRAHPQANVVDEQLVLDAHEMHRAQELHEALEHRHELPGRNVDRDVVLAVEPAGADQPTQQEREVVALVAHTAHQLAVVGEVGAAQGSFEVALDLLDADVAQRSLRLRSRWPSAPRIHSRISGSAGSSASSSAAPATSVWLSDSAMAAATCCPRLPGSVLRSSPAGVSHSTNRETPGFPARPPST